SFGIPEPDLATVTAEQGAMPIVCESQAVDGGWHIKTAQLPARVDIPEACRIVPTSGQRPATVRRESYAGDNAVVPLKSAQFFCLAQIPQSAGSVGQHAARITAAAGKRIAAVWRDRHGPNFCGVSYEGAYFCTRRQI